MIYADAAWAGLLSLFRYLWSVVVRAVTTLLRAAPSSSSTKTVTLSHGGRRVSYSPSSPIGEGGFSYVYLAKDDLGQAFALKILLCQVEEQREAAHAEIQRHGDFSHPNLMPLIDWGFVNADSVEQRGQHALLLFPYMSGGSLRELIDARVLGGRGLGEDEILRIFAGVCAGVAVLHSANPPVAHRDIKPENVLLRGDGMPVLMDFGSMAPAERQVKNRIEALILQDEAAQFSTVPYRAPELFDVASDASIDARTDVWSLGCLLYALAFGYSPFECEFSNGRSRVVECSFLRVIGAIPWPSHHQYSKSFCSLVCWILQIENRPNVHDVLLRAHELLQCTNGSRSLPQGQVV